MPRKKKVDILEQFFDFIKNKAKDATIRDLAYLASYTGAVFLAYEFIEEISLSRVLSPTWYETIWTIGLLPKRYKFPISEKPEKEFNINSFAKALVVAHMVLRIDVSDVASAVGKLSTTVISGLISGETLTPVP